ncbi:MAG: FG-GAP-like repeat-containing protein [Pseudoalteromonas prydzensis]|uniref:FG-GAP-like repeat-containing protein n=1 Tax=Pseudoalteromonas prydzensis TaxID=182141 RepID=UPI003F9E4B70
MKLLKTPSYIYFLLFFCSLAFAQEYVGLSNGSFRVDEMGAANYSMPISLPDGIAGVKPSLAFNYSSQSGDGYMGVGWQISGTNTISRCPKNMTQDNEQNGITFSDTDRLCLDGQRLVSWGKNNDKTTTNSQYWNLGKYHKEIDDFSIVRMHGSTAHGPKAFTVETKSGEIHYYGQVSTVNGTDSMGKSLAIDLVDANGANDNGFDAFVNSGSQNAARMWALKAIKDIKGNYILFKYSKNTVKGEHYLTEVQYTGRVSGQRPFARAVFNYQSNSTKRSGWLAGTPYSLSKLLTNVSIYLDSELYRYYDLRYDEPDYIEHKNTLTSVQECTDKNLSQCLPATTFSWQKPASNSTHNPFNGGYSVEGSSPNRDFNQLLDLNGDGYTDIVYPSGSYWYVEFGPDYSSPERLSSVGVNKKQFAKTIDYNGDGKRDLLVANSETSNWYIISYESSTSSYQSCEPDGRGGKLCVPEQLNLNYTLTDTGVRAYGLEGNSETADIDGDGLEDILFVQNGLLKAYMNQGNGRFTLKSNLGSLSNNASGIGLNSIPYTRASLKNTSSFDFNGDGRTDILTKVKETRSFCSKGGSVVRSRNECVNDLLGKWIVTTTDNWQLYESNGNGYVKTTDLGSSYDNVRIVDLNGDGNTDIAFQMNNKWYYRLSDGKKFLSAQPINLSTSTAALTNNLFFIDLNQNGMADLLYPSSSNQWTVYITSAHDDNDKVVFNRRGNRSYPSNAAIRFADLNADTKVDLLYATSDNGWNTFYGSDANSKDYVINEITSGWGVGTRISYDNITNSDVYFRDNSSHNTGTEYFSPKSGLFVVSKVETDVSNNNAVGVAYQYGGLLLHKKGRGSLGFEVLRTTDEQTGVVTETIYDQRWPYIGMPKSTVQKKDNATLSYSVNSLSAKRTYSGGTFAYIGSSKELSNMYGSDQSEYQLSKTQSSFNYDTYGNVINSSVTVSDPNDNSSQLITTTVNSYGTAALYKAKGRLVASTVTKKLTTDNILVSQISRESAFTYYPDLMLKTSVLSPNNASYKQTTTYEYDIAGNQIKKSLTASKNATAGQFETRYSTTLYDKRFRYVKKISNQLNESEVYKYNGVSADSVTGIINNIETTDANNQVTKVIYNSLGQQVSSSIKGASSADTTLYTYYYKYYCSSTGCGNNNAYVLQQTRQTGKPNKKVFIDKFGRKIETQTQLQDNSWSVQQQSYDQQGRPSYIYEAGKGAASSYYTQLTYDELGSLAETESANGAVTTEQHYGYETISTNSKGQKTTITKNFLGQKVSVEDNLGTLLKYKYDAYGNLLAVSIDAHGKVTTRTKNVYDQYGRKISTDDQDKGKWLYSYNGFGELIKQKNAKNQDVNFEYDVLGRQTRRYDNSGTVCWDYGTTTSAYATGKLIKLRYYEGRSISCDTTAAASYSQTLAYNSRSLPEVVTQVSDGQTFVTKTGYDNYYRTLTQTYPANNFTIRYVYENGYAAKLVNHQTGRVYQQIDAVNGRGQTTQLSYANNVIENIDYADSTGWMSYKSVKKSSLIQGTSFSYDKLGNVTAKNVKYGVGSRADFIERFDYDGLNRLLKRDILLVANEPEICAGGCDPEPEPCELGYSSMQKKEEKEILTQRAQLCLMGTSSAKSNVSSTKMTFFPVEPPVISGEKSYSTHGLPKEYAMSSSITYDDLGNINYKKGAGYYKYDTNNSNRLVAVYKNSNFTGTKYYNLDYDANGNITNDGKRQFYYTSFDKPSKIVQGNDISEFSYGPMRELYKRKDAFNGKITITLYLGNYEKITLPSGVVEHKFYVGNVVVTQRSNGTDDEYYLHKDNQGSTTSITDKNGHVVQQFVYEPWGKQYTVHNSGALASYQSPSVSRGYTGHKMINELGIIHMNGRIYDPTLGRFVQADPFVQAPLYSQSYNRYSYVINNPLSYTDPTGYFFSGLKKLGKKLNRWRRQSHRYDYAYQEYKATSNAALRVHFGIHSTLSKNVSFVRNVDHYVATHRWAQTGALAVATYYGGPYGTAAASAHIAYSQGASIDDIRMAGQNAFASAYMFQSINNYYGATWTMGRVGWTATAGGATSKLYDGQFIDGFMYAGIPALARYAYYRVSMIEGYNPSGKPHLWQEGKSDVGKQLDKDTLRQLANGTLDKAPLSSDQSAFMQGVAKGPYMDAFAEFHDGLHELPYVPVDQVSLILTMPPSYAVTLLAAMQPYTQLYIWDREGRR